MRNLIATMLLTACTMDTGFVSLSDDYLVPPVIEQIDILYVLDYSCSMFNDWNSLSFGLAYTTTELDQHGTDYQLAMITTDPADTDIWVEINPDAESSWEIATTLTELKSQAGGGESGFASALQALDLHSTWFRDGWQMIVFVSDEPEQSDPLITVDDFRDSWKHPLWVVSITGPYEDTTSDQWYTDPSYCDAEAAPQYHDVADRVIDICKSEPFSLLDGLF